MVHRRTPHGEFHALICIDITPNLDDVVHTDSKASDVIANEIEQTWLALYPRLIKVVNGNGGEGRGYVFTYHLSVLEIKGVLTTCINPQFNAL